MKKSLKTPKGVIDIRSPNPQALVSFKKYMPPPLLFSLICDPFADPIISLHSRDISIFDCHI